MDAGKARRLSRIFDKESGKTVIVPLDDSLLAGPEGGLRHRSTKVRQIVGSEANAIMGFRGLFSQCAEQLSLLGGILNLTASTTRSVHTRKVLVSRVDEALQLGLDAVGVHVNISSQYEAEMLKILGEISRECASQGMPLMALVYPRTERDGHDYNYDDLKMDNREEYAELVRHTVRVGVDLGADFVKCQYTGDPETFSTVIECASGIPVVTAGGPLVTVEAMLENAYGAVVAGAAGISFGRNVFHRDDSSPYIKALSAIVHKGLSDREAASLV